MWDKISEAWCKTMHKQSMWPMHGRYICSECHREYPVLWTGPDKLEQQPAIPTASARRLVGSRGTLATMKHYFRSAIT